MEKKQSVIGIGEALFDVLPEGKKLGGAPANFAYHVSQFGLNSLDNPGKPERIVTVRRMGYKWNSVE